MTDAPGADPSLRLGMLLEALDVQRETAAQAVEQLVRHTHGLDAIVRDEIGQTLRGELSALQADVLDAQVALRGLSRRLSARHLLGSLLVGVVAAAAPLLLASTLLPGPAELRRLRAEEAMLQDRLRELRQTGAKLELRRCGRERSLCVRVERDRGAFGSDGAFFIVKGG